MQSPKTLRDQAAQLREQSRQLFQISQVAGSVPERAEILRLSRLASQLEQEALQSEEQVIPLESISEETIERLVNESVISRVEEGLYISGYDALEDDSVLKDIGITHILSACAYYRPNTAQQKLYTCKSLAVLDTADENLVKFFAVCNAFINDAHAEHGKVLVHCHAGQSRSATVVVAFIMQKYRLGVHEALDRVKAVRRVEPNENFMNQLRIYRECDYTCLEDSVLYRRWRFDQMHQSLNEVQTSKAAGERTEYQETDTNSKYTQIRCKKCRFVLASENHIIAHEPKTHTELPDSPQSSLIPPSCAHFFLEPIRWMKTELEKGALDGRFACPNPKCSAKIGSYAWQGMTCSCRRWILPALCIQRSKVDEMKSKTPAKVEPARRAQPQATK